MPDEHKSDMIMRFADKDGQDIDAECALAVSPSDKDFMKGFTAATYDDYSNFFQISKFSFGFDVKDEAQSKQGVGDAKGLKNATQNAFSARVQGEFASWRSATEADAKNISFQLEFETFQFERLIDSASPIFFQNCCDSVSFKEAVLVKRLSRGGDVASMNEERSIPEGFIRMEFKDVLITGLSWDDGAMTTEKCEFICRDFTLKYRPQLMSGAWGPISEAHWNYIVDSKIKEETPSK